MPATVTGEASFIYGSCGCLSWVINRTEQTADTAMAPMIKIAAALAFFTLIWTFALTLWPSAVDGISQVVSGEPKAEQSQGATRKRVVEISIRDGELLGGPVHAAQNDVLVLKIKSDEEEQFHIEGYHAFANLSPGHTVTLEVWTATIGHFPILLDKSKRHIGSLEVVSRLE